MSWQGHRSTPSISHTLRNYLEGFVLIGFAVFSVIGGDADTRRREGLLLFLAPPLKMILIKSYHLIVNGFST